MAAGGQRVLEMYHQCQERSEFYSMVDLSRLPVLFTPESDSSSPSPASNNTIVSQSVFPSPPGGGGGSLLGERVGSTTAGGIKQVTDLARRKAYPPSDTRMVVYVRQENEEIYTPLHLVPPTVPGIINLLFQTIF